MTISRTLRSMSSLMPIFELVQSRQAGVFHKPHLAALTFDEILSKSTVTSKIKNKWLADEKLKIFLQFGFNTGSGATTKVKL